MESFFVIDGTFEFMIDGKTQMATTGDFITIPDGAVHAFTNIGDRHGRILIINAPGKIHEAMFTGIGSPLADDATDVPPPDGPPDIPRLIDIAARSGVTILPPPAQ
jgi:uncharacterized cupin superfamily protein